MEIMSLQDSLEVVQARTVEMWATLDDKMQDVLHPVAYYIIVVLLQLLAQFFYGTREFVRSAHLHILSFFAGFPYSNEL